MSWRRTHDARDGADHAAARRGRPALLVSLAAVAAVATLVLVAAVLVVPEIAGSAAGSAPVTVVNTPLPVTGNVALSGTPSVSIAGTPTVGLSTSANTVKIDSEANTVAHEAHVLFHGVLENDEIPPEQSQSTGRFPIDTAGKIRLWAATVGPCLTVDVRVLVPAPGESFSYVLDEFTVEGCNDRTRIYEIAGTELFVSWRAEDGRGSMAFTVFGI